jgi:RNA polymerase sigma-32 factor
MQTALSSVSPSPSLSIAKPKSKSKPSVEDAELGLLRRFQGGDMRAGDTLMRNHLGLVRSIAHGYRLWGVPVEDLVQQGCIGLLKAMQRFDAARTQTLQSYAGYWIRAEIREYVVRTYRIVRLGSTRTERKALRMFRVRSIETPQDLAKESGMPLARCEQLWPLLARGDSHIDDTRKCAAPLDRVMWNAYDPEVLALQSERTSQLKDRVSAALSQLSDRERRIIEARMMNDEPRTLESLAAEFGLSRERVRQLEAAAKAKIKCQLEVDEVAA